MISPLPRFFVFTAGLALTSAILQGADAPVYLDKNAPLESRVNDLMGRLSPDEKIALLSGASACTTPAIPRLQIPPMRMADAGAGVRGIDKSNGGPATSFTCGVMMASTWDPALVGRVAAAIGEEARNKGLGSQILLGPAVNIQRSPLGGRNGEYFSEDPYLTARMAVGYIQGMQGEGTAACIKHFACNNEEVDRGSVNVEVSERALREIYLPAFAAGVKEGHAWTLMSSYNCVNGFHSTANNYLLTDVLKEGWGFDGAVISDWGAVHSVAPVLNAGNDIEMPGPPKQLTPENVRLALQSGQITQEAIDRAVRRTVRTIIRTGLLDGPWKTDPAMVNSPAHQALARELAEQGIVLLKNEKDILPLDPATIHSIALVGPAAVGFQTGALGSPYVHPPYAIGPRDGITRRVNGKIAITCVSEEVANVTIPKEAFVPAGDAPGHGLTAEYFANQNLQGTPVATRVEREINFNWPEPVEPHVPGVGPTHFSIRWTGKLTAPETGRYLISFSADDGCRLYIDDRKIIDHWTANNGQPVTGEVDLVAGRSYAIRAEYFQGAGKAEARLEWEIPQTSRRVAEVAAAGAADVAIVFVTTGRKEGEGHDRPSMALPADQDALVQAVAAANKRTIVVLNNGTPVDMRSWIDQVPGLLEVWFPGQEGGDALAAVLFGDVDPSGKLPTTLGYRREDYPDYGHFPGVDGVVRYAEGIYVGYRHFDKEKIKPLFPFGYGLSYTTFSYGPLQLSSATLPVNGAVHVSLRVKNTGTREGREVVELYVHQPSPTIDRPVRELKGFAKIDLAPGESKSVSLAVTPRDLAYFDTPGREWKADAGDYEIEVGASSRDICQKATVHLAGTFTQSVPLSHDFLAAESAATK